MAQTKVTEFFSTRKRSFDLIQPSKRLKLSTGFDEDIKKPRPKPIVVEHRPIVSSTQSSKVRRAIKRKGSACISSAGNIKDFLAKASNLQLRDSPSSGSSTCSESTAWPCLNTATLQVCEPSVIVPSSVQHANSTVIIPPTPVLDCVSKTLPLSSHDMTGILQKKVNLIPRGSSLKDSLVNVSIGGNVSEQKIVKLDLSKEISNMPSTDEHIMSFSKLTVSKSVAHQKRDQLKEKIAKFKESIANVKHPQKSEIAVPAHERFHSVAEKAAEVLLVLPFKYRLLLEMFRAVETVVSMLFNRKEVCTFDKLKNSVQELLKRAFDKSRLGQIKTVYPSAYNFQIETHVKSFSSATRVTSAQLTIIPNLVAPENSKLTGQKENVPQMNPTIRLKRQQIFNRNLVKIVKTHHERFLANQTPPMCVPSDQIMRWHPRFPLDNVPDIQATALPEIQENQVSTAQDVLAKMKGVVGNRVELALQSVADSQPKLVSTKTVVPIKVASGALKGISQALLEKIKAKENSKIAREILRKPESEKKIEMMSRLPEVVRIIRNVFVVERRAAIALEDAKRKICDSYRSAMSPLEAEEHLNLLFEIVPKWLVFVTISKGVFIKIDKNRDITDLVKIIEAAIQTEKC